jgi:phosphoribosyl 1,2-cyclic phosphodiesterase
MHDIVRPLRGGSSIVEADNRPRGLRPGAAIRYNAAMRLISLQSGSNGNCLYIEAGQTRLLIDAGISGKQAQLRLAEHGVDIRDVDAVLISHDHSDHTRSMGIYQRKFGLEVWATPRTVSAANRTGRLGKMDRLRTLCLTQPLQLGCLEVRCVRTPHDAVEGVAFVVTGEGKRLGVLTDLGNVFDGLDELIRSLDAVLIESNYDDEMLETGPYPYHLKRRIRGSGGHISNVEAAELIDRCGAGLAWACLGHLSGENNTPELAVETARQVVGRKMPIHLATRYRVSEAMQL